MLRTRVIPCLLLRNGGLVKTVQFDNPKYVGDPINAVRIFNEKEVDEIAILDITATPSNKEPNFELIADLASQAFMPLSYGGGINSTEQIEKLFSIGIEKIILNSVLEHKPELITSAANIAGSSSVVASIDVKSNWLGKYSVYTNSGKKDIKVDPISYAKRLENLGAGEIIINSIDRDGTQKGYDTKLVGAISDAVSIPVVAIGGAGKLSDFKEAVDVGASAVAAGSFFVFHGKHRAVLITYPEYSTLEELFN
ncbi:MAG TPA: imidazole glycerol phosphate synthase subunit HisF [Balneola sp.]|jgi:imidazole glycerol-phosphate synthase subunit HisF|nr:imidazole glycerol phosphate synthase subunit HisF [Balneola sp.]MAO77140.1 imidazole glycerol phosphate synthase subunit HisF [Balneola sp.]MBF63411.1 imidazole glycerol phosphate synthase subunit HisF [Balneola sp.]HAH50521.1 imidazole glycerol phosphate synthase subunit HisF [Balneola sp.]|tara:strand:+ start:22280 stop:23038 length:759 start_codon:yes stop_codon:yes gene_type:complete